MTRRRRWPRTFTTLTLICGHEFAAWNTIPAVGDEVWCRRCGLPSVVEVNDQHAARSRRTANGIRHTASHTESDGGQDPPESCSGT